MKKLIATILVACAAVLAPPAHAQSSPDNTIVRFEIFTEGTNFGTIDIELFDHDKPESVRNFLLYVYSGVYSNMVIHRVVTNFIMQAGYVLATNRNSSDQFLRYKEAANYGNVTNELNVGPHLSNLYGTIAVARSDDLNSGSSHWFINLNDNVDLDTLGGGYAVFGRVINTTGPNTGTNVLNYFRNAPHVTTPQTPVYTVEPFDAFRALPLAVERYTTNGSGVVSAAPVQVRDLFTYRASVLHSSVTRDRHRPKLLLREPVRSLRVVTNDTVTANGSASDNQEVARVLFHTPQGVFLGAGTTAWTAQLSLTPGTNTFYVSAIDWFGNESPRQKRTIFYQKATPIKLSTSGDGVVLGATNGQMLDIGRFYTLEARPAKGNFFATWTNWAVIHPEQPKTKIFMQVGLDIKAVFSTNYFPSLRGTYSGVMMPASGTGKTAGWLTLNMTASGRYQGRLQPLTASFPIHGGFNRAQQSYIYGGTLGLGLRLMTNGPASIEGLFSDSGQIAQVKLYRVEPVESSSVPAGHYTFGVLSQLNSAAGDGFGVGTADVSADGAVTVGGMLQDGMEFNSRTKLYAGNHWPIFIKWSSSRALLGWMEFTADGFGGNLLWVNNAFPSHFENAAAVGSRYTPPAAGASPLTWSSGTATLSGDGLTNEVVTGVTVHDNGIDVTQNDVNLHFDPPGADGRFTGSFTHPVTHETAPIQGVFLQNTNRAAGFFRTATRSGSLLLTQ